MSSGLLTSEIPTPAPGKIICLPDIRGEQNIFSSDFYYYHPERAERAFETNLKIVKSIDVASLPREAQSFWPKMINYWEENKEKALRVLRSMKQKDPKTTFDVRDTLEESFGAETVGPLKPAVSYQNLGEIINEKFADSKETIVAVSASHATTAATIKSAVVQREREKQENLMVGIIVFDSHADIFRSNPRSAKPLKNNVFGYLFENQDLPVGRVAIFGPPSGLIEEIKDDEQRREGSVHDFSPAVLEKTEIIGEDEYCHNQRMSQEKLNQKIEEVVISWLERGITNIVFSIDADILRTGKMAYTASEYNPLLAFTFLASQDFRDLSVNEIYRRLVWWIQEEHRDNPIAWYTGRLGSFGLSLGQLGRAIDQAATVARKRGIKIGIELKKGGTFVGDIVEAGWPDYKKRTARAIGPLANRLLSVSTSVL